MSQREAGAEEDSAGALPANALIDCEPGEPKNGERVPREASSVGLGQFDDLHLRGRHSGEAYASTYCSRAARVSGEEVWDA